MSLPKLKVTSFTLKILAILGMTANHWAHVFVHSEFVWLTALLYSFGGLTFPIFSYLIVEGYIHTSNLKRYVQRLLIFAFVSEIPYWLIFGNSLNVLFTLLLGLWIIWAWDNAESKFTFALVLVVAMAASYFCDWSFDGPIMVFLFYVLRDQGNRGILLTMLVPYAVVLIYPIVLLPDTIVHGLQMGANAVAAGIDDAYVMIDLVGQPLLLRNDTFLYICNIGYAVVGFTLATLFLCKYNGQRGRPMKWFFYVYYPAHLLVIWGIHWVLSGMPAIF